MITNFKGISLSREPRTALTLIADWPENLSPGIVLIVPTEYDGYWDIHNTQPIACMALKADVIMVEV